MRTKTDLALWLLAPATAGALLWLLVAPTTGPTGAVPKPEAAMSVPVYPVTVFVPLVALIGENPADVYFCVPGAPKPRSGCEGIAEYYRTEAECIAMRFDIIGREHANHRTVSSDCIAKPLIDKPDRS